jgi:integrase
MDSSRTHEGGREVFPDGFTCALSDEAIRILREARALLPESESCFGQDNFRTAAFHKAAGRAGLKVLRWHDLRHTGASWAVQNGVSLPQLMDLGGWKSYRMVLVYARFAPSDAARAAEVVGTNVAQAVRGEKGESA